jgi:phage N-6-adenine-methyltransferase
MNKQQQSVLFSSAAKGSGKDTWKTPQDRFAALHEEFAFTIDGAANATNHLLPRWWGPGSKEAQDALEVDWKYERVFCNPPYSLVKQFVEKAYWERDRSVSVLLIPSRTDTRWWHSCIWHEKKRQWRKGVTGRFVKGRIKFINPDSPLLRGTSMNGSNNSAPFPSVVIVFGGDETV